MTASFPAPLLDRLTKLGNDAVSDLMNGSEAKANKFAILSTALANFPARVTSSVKVTALANPDDYKQAPGKPPSYFGRPFGNHPVSVTPKTTDRYGQAYDYQAVGPNVLWVDFAAIRLGGGVFGEGMLQEETMMAKMPELANAAAPGDLFTRDGTGSGALESNPTPLVIFGVHPTIDISDALLKDDKWKTATMKELLNGIIPFDKGQQSVNILAMAVPHLKDKTPALQTETNAVYDLFNTFVAGFYAAKTNRKDQTTNATINTGGIGTGNFNNSRVVVYILQNLAARHLGGVDVIYWGLSHDDASTWNGYVDRIIAEFDKEPDKTVKKVLSIAQSLLQQVVT